MNKSIIDKLESGVLTEKMKRSGVEYEDFRLLIRSKSENLTKSEQVRVSLTVLEIQMEDYLSDGKRLIEIGKFIKLFIEALEVSQRKFAKYLEIRPSNLGKLLNGERKLNLETALIFEKLSGIKASLWLRVQTKNEIKKITKLNKSKFKKFKLDELIS